MNAAESALLRRYRAEIFVATWGSYFGFYVVRKIYAVVKHPLKVQFGLDDLQVAYPWTIYLVTYMLGQFLAAWLGRRYRSRTILLYGMSVAAACNVAFGWLVESHGADAYTWMCVTMGIQGFAQATGWPHNVALFANWTRRSERGTLFGIWGTCYQFGAIAGKWLAAFLLGWAGVAWSYFGASILLLALTLLFAFWARERPQSVGLSLEDTQEADVAHTAAGTPASTVREALPAGWIRSIVAMGVIYFGFKFLRYALDSWSALILTDQFGMSASLAGYWSAAFDWIGFLGVIFGGWWSDRIGARRTPVIFVMSLACLVFTFLMWFVGLASPTAFIVLLGLIGFTAMGPDSLLSGACAMDAGSRRQAALAAGVINGLGSIGPIVQEPVIGWLKQQEGVGAVFLLLLGVVSLTTVGTGLLARYERGRL